MRRQRFNFPHIYCECTKLITFILKDTWHTTCFLQELTVSYNLTSVPVCYLLTWQLIWKITKCRYTSMPKWDNYKSVSLLILAVTPRSCTSAVCTVALITTAGRRQNLYFGRLRYLSGKWPRGRGDPGEKSWSRTKLYISALLLWLLLWSSGKGKGKGSTQEGHSKVIYGWWMVDGGYPFPDALH